jgi:hypothetical protein
MPGKDTDVQAIRSTLKTQHCETFIDIIFILCSLLCWVCQIGIKTPIDVCIQ